MNQETTHIALLSIGSNVYSRTNIDKAKRMLLRTFEGIEFTSSIMSAPYDETHLFPFRNVLAAFETTLTKEEIIAKIKQIERAGGRTPYDKETGRINLDIDLLKYDDEILRPTDYERDYVQQLLREFSAE